MTDIRCCPGAGTMAHVRGCAHHPESERDATERHGRPDGCRPGDGCPCYPEIPDRLAAAIGAALFNVSNLPMWMQAPALGRDMSSLRNMVADKVLRSDWLATVRREAWDEGALACSEGRGSDANPYARWTR